MKVINQFYHILVTYITMTFLFKIDLTFIMQWVKWVQNSLASKFSPINHVTTNVHPMKSWGELSILLGIHKNLSENGNNKKQREKRLWNIINEMFCISTHKQDKSVSPHEIFNLNIIEKECKVIRLLSARGYEFSWWIFNIFCGSEICLVAIDSSRKLDPMKIIVTSHVVTSLWLVFD